MAIIFLCSSDSRMRSDKMKKTNNTKKKISEGIGADDDNSEDKQIPGWKGRALIAEGVNRLKVIQQEQRNKKKKTNERIQDLVFANTSQTPQTLQTSATPILSKEAKQQILQSRSSSVQPQRSKQRFFGAQSVLLKKIDSDSDQSYDSDDNPNRRKKHRKNKRKNNLQQSSSQQRNRQFSHSPSTQRQYSSQKHPYRKHLAISKSKQQLHRKLSKPLLKRQISAYNINQTPGPISAVATQTAPQLVYNYVIDMKTQNFLLINQHTQTRRQCLKGFDYQSQPAGTQSEIEAQQNDKARKLYEAQALSNEALKSNRIGQILQNSRMSGDSYESIHPNWKQNDSDEGYISSINQDRNNQVCSEQFKDGHLQLYFDKNGQRKKILANGRDWSTFGLKKGKSKFTQFAENSVPHGEGCGPNCEHLRRGLSISWKMPKNRQLLPMKKQLMNDQS